MDRAKSKNILISIIVLLLIILTVGYGGYLIKRNFGYTCVDSSESFLNGDYVSFNGGYSAQQFFEKYVDTAEYKNISFKYADSEKIIWLEEFYSTFVLDIQYKKEKYEVLKQELLLHTNNPDQNKLSNYYEGFLLTKIDSQEKLYTENYCGIYFNDEFHIVRYIFIKDVPEKEILYGGEIYVIDRNIAINWNINEDDLIFSQ